MDIGIIFDKLQTQEAVYLYDEYENCVMKVFVGDDGETVKALFKWKGKEPGNVDITSPAIFDIMNESDETTQEFYEEY